LGGGGQKPNKIISLQESDKLTSENYLLREVSKNITQRIKNKEIEWPEDYMDLTGNLEFNTEEYD